LLPGSIVRATNVDKKTKTPVVWTEAASRHRIMPMRFIMAVIVAAMGYVAYMIGNDVFTHDQTFVEAWKGAPQQFIQSLGQLAVLAWQYKVVTLIALGIVTAVLLVRLVPDIKNQAQRR
jgi:hypothetical protein